MTPNTKPTPAVLPGDEMLTWEEVTALGLEEAPEDFGPAEDEMEADHG